MDGLSWLLHPMTKWSPVLTNNMYVCMMCQVDVNTQNKWMVFSPFILFCVVKAPWGVKGAVVTLDVPDQVLYGFPGLSLRVKLHAGLWNLYSKRVKKNMPIIRNWHVVDLTKTWRDSDIPVWGVLSQRDLWSFCRLFLSLLLLKRVFWSSSGFGLSTEPVP